MALARYEREKETTIGRGNCAFNAFTLALCDSPVFSQIERSLLAAHENADDRFKQFISSASEILRVSPNWAAVKNELLRLREHGKEELQNKIAPILRQLSIDIAVHSPDAVFLKCKTVEQLQSAYSDYQRKRQGKSVTSDDDVFSRHRFITDKFYDVYWGKEKDKLQRKKIIENWWWNAGYDQFLREMRKDGEWAGDVELARLAKYFNVVLEVVPEEGFSYNIYGDYGYFPFLDDEAGKAIPKNERAEMIDVLSRRMVITQDHENVHAFGVNFALPSLWAINRRLEKVPNCKQVMEFISQQPKLKGEIVPKWPQPCLDELIQRNVIGRHSNGKDYQFSVDANDAMLLINEIPHCRAVNEICRRYFKALPTLVLHKSTDHWSNTLKIISPEEKERQKKLREEMAKLKPSFFSASSIMQQPAGARIGLRNSADSVVRGKN